MTHFFKQGSFLFFPPRVRVKDFQRHFSFQGLHAKQNQNNNNRFALLCGATILPSTLIVVLVS